LCPWQSCQSCSSLRDHGGEPIGRAALLSLGVVVVTDGAGTLHTVRSDTL
jgi:hypothetical protein